MFLLKIIVISSAILDIGFSATQCDSNDVLQFSCHHPECKVENEHILGRLLTKPNDEVNILGYTEDDLFLIKNKKILSIEPKSRISIKNWNPIQNWKHKVNIHKNTVSICEPKIINQSNDESYNDFNNAQISKNTDEKKIQTSDEVSSKEPTIKNFDNINETDNLNITENEDIDEIIHIEIEDELNPDITTKQVESTNSDQNINFEPIEQQTHLNEKIDQNNITQSTSPKNLQNDAAKEYALDPVKNKLNEKVVTNEASNNIYPVNEDILHSKKTESTSNASHQYSKNSNDNIKDTINVQDSHNDAEKLSTSNTVNDSANKREPQFSDSSIANNNIKEFISHGDHKKKTDSTLNIPHQNFENSSDNIKNTVNVQDSHNGTEKLSTSNTVNDSANKREPQVSDSSIANNNAKEFISDGDHKKKTDSTPNIPHQHFENASDHMKDAVNVQDSHNGSEKLSTSNTVNDLVNKRESQFSDSSIANNNAKEFNSDILYSKKTDSTPNASYQHFENTNNNIKDTVDIQDGNSGTEQLRTSNTVNDSANKREPRVSDSSIANNNAKEFISDSDHKKKTDSTPNIPHQNFENSSNNIKDTAKTVSFQNSIKISEIHDNNNSMEIINETLQNISSLESITDNQSVNDNYTQVSLTEEKIEIINEHNIPKDFNGDNLQDYTNISVVNETQKQPDITKTENESEYQNISENPNIEPITSNNDQISGKTSSSSTQDLMNTSDANQKQIDQCASEDGCSHSLDSNQKYDIEKSKLENKIYSDTVHESSEPNSNEQLKKYEPKSFVESFGHPGACSGVKCLTFNRNLEKVIKSPPINPSQKQANSVETSKLENTNIINEITEESHVEISFFDYFQNWISSPTTNSINFLWNIFSDFSKEQNDVYHVQSVEDHKIFQNINHSELYFITVAVITLLFSLIYYKYQKGTYENYLLTLLATKDQSLLIIEKELSLLKEQSTGSMITTTEKNFEVETLNDHLTKSEDIISSQAIRIEKLEQEVEELTESGMEMHTILSSALENSSKNTEKLNSLKSKLIDSENLIATLTQKNFDKTTELEKKNEIIKSIQINIDELTIKNMNLVEENAKISLQLEQNITKNMLKESKLQGEINNLQYELDRQTSSLVATENEVLLSKNALQEMVSQKCNPADVKKILSSVKLSAELKSAQQMSESYKQKLNESLKLNQQYLDKIDVLKSDITNLEDKLQKLEKKNEESINKLTILTNFFKEQEKNYLKQINEKAELCVSKEGESSSLNERIKSQNQEIANYKGEIQSLKKEITDQEASFKIQLSAADKKASDYWISFRQAERKLKEMELETAQLRNKLTVVDKKLENGAKSIDSSKDFEDELLDIPLPTVSPDFTLLSLLDFEPPPPILTNQRLPPLGALGQAPSPPIPLSRRHNRSLSPGSPPPSQRSSVFRPLPQRYNYMDRQNSLGHSVESLDK